MAYDVNFSNSWAIMSFSQKAFPKRLVKIAFSKRAFLVQTDLPNNYQPNTNLAVLTTAKLFKKALFYQKAHVTKHPLSAKLKQRFVKQLGSCCCWA